MRKKLVAIIDESLAVKETLKKRELDNIARAVDVIISSLKSGGKLIVFGNGGSAADAQHMAGELVGRFQKERKAIPAIALTTNTSTITALANDYGYERTFSRQIEALAKTADVILAISTSGRSKNIIEAVRLAKKLNLKTIALSGKDGGELSRLSDVAIVVRSDSTPRIQESHILIIHAICQIIEEALFA